MTAPARRMVVINADDLGMSDDVNGAILECFEQGLISSSTIMANMPATDAAAELVLRHGLAGRIGIHLNLTQGVPLSEPIRHDARFCDPEGRFHAARTIWRLSAAEGRAVGEELDAQVRAIRDRGIPISHIDSHHHVHTQWPLVGLTMRLARRFGIPAVRLSRNLGPRASIARQAYKRLVNGRLERAGLAAVRSFGSAIDADVPEEATGPVELMLHPGRAQDGRLIDVISGRDDLPDIAARWRSWGTLVGYRDLAA